MPIRPAIARSAAAEPPAVLASSASPWPASTASLSCFSFPTTRFQSSSASCRVRATESAGSQRRPSRETTTSRPSGPSLRSVASFIRSLLKNVQALTGYSAVQPPSTTRLEPVIKADASEARNTTAPITSSTCPIRPSLILESTLSAKALSSKYGRVSGVSMNVGAMALLRIPCGARSRAMALFRPSIAHLEAQ